MAVRDLENFLRQQAALYAPDENVGPGSPFDNKIVQPLLRRLGTDPFTVDLATFLFTRLQQAFPELATDEGDALVDLLVKPAALLWDPIVREINRIKQNQSFADPSILTVEEADALGANMFSERETGDFSRGIGRVWFSQPQGLSVTPINFITSKTGLRFFPQEVQSIRAEEMVLNHSTTEGLYYFDVSVIAEKAGSEYNIGPNSLVSIANIPAAVKVTNPNKFDTGARAETASEFIGRARQELTERSMVGLRGISAALTKAFPELRRLNVVGFGDPEMHRDIIMGGAYGDILLSGATGYTPRDNKGFSKTSWLADTSVDFTSIIGLIGDAPAGYVLTVFGAFGIQYVVRDLPVTKVISTTSVEVDEQAFVYGLTALNWTLRRRVITLDKIPGGILYPDGARGTVDIPVDTIHVGGAVDVHVRGTELTEGTLVLEAITDDDPILSGVAAAANSSEQVTLNDLTLSTNYFDGDATSEALARAPIDQYSLHILNGPNLGVYRVYRVVEVAGSSPIVYITPGVTTPSADEYRWKLVDTLTIDLVTPKDTKVEGTDLIATQGSTTIRTVGGTDFVERNVLEDDVVEIFEGPNAGVYGVASDPAAPAITDIILDTPMMWSQTGLRYRVYRPNPTGGITRPVMRVKSVDLLDSSGQTVGVKIPYAKPIDVQSRSFQNSARGVKHDFSDVRLGLVSIPATAGSFTVPAGGTLVFSLLDGNPSTTVTLTGGVMTVAAVQAELETQLAAAFGETNFCISIAGDMFGIRPFGATGIVSIIDGSARTVLFGSAEQFTTMDMRSESADFLGGWSAMTPLIDYVTGLEVVQVLSGEQIGFYQTPFYAQSTVLVVAHYVSGGAFNVYDTATPFAPEAGIRVELGAKSIGSARCYFLEPTTVEFGVDTVFTVVAASGETLRYMPDPTLNSQRIPALPSGDMPRDGSAPLTSSAVFTSAISDFVAAGIQPGDELIVERFPLGGTVVVADPVVDLVGKKLVYSMDDGPDRTIVFVPYDMSIPDDVSLDAVVEQINASMGADVAAVTLGGTLEFISDSLICIKTSSTCFTELLGNINGSGGVVFSAGTTIQRSNRAPHYGTHVVSAVANTTLTVDTNFAVVPDYAGYDSPVTRQSFKVMRSGTQRICTAQMAEQEAEAGLYYMDVELVSEGAGDQWNIPSELQMTVTGYRSDGYYLTTENEDLSFSEQEDITLMVSRSILNEGVNDNPSDALHLSGQNIQVTFERGSIVPNVQSFLMADTERVINSSPLARYLIPYYVRMDINYRGGETVDNMLQLTENHITDLYSVDSLYASNVQKLFLDKGATYVTNPLDMVAVVYATDRSVWAERSRDALGLENRLSSFIPDVLNLTKLVG